jgi:hypothetical protein
MQYTLTLPYLNKYTRYFNDLAKAGVEFEIEVTTTYNNEASAYIPNLIPRLKGINSLEKLAKAWLAGRIAIKTSSMTDFPALKNVYNKPNTQPISAGLYKGDHPSIKYYAEAVFSELRHLGVHLLTGPPLEQKIGESTYRICCTSGSYYDSQVVYCAPETDPCYNYIDQGHVVITVSGVDQPETGMFVTNMLTLDMNYLLAAFSVYPEGLPQVVANKAFIPAKDLRLILIKLEKLIPPRLQDKYRKLKAAILADFEKNTCNIMIGKLTRNEAPYVDINNIRITLNKAHYAAGNVSIEADNLAQVIFKSLNPNEEWDIFTLVNIYTDWVESQFKEMELNDACSGFKTAKTFKFKINGIPLKIDCFTDNTRRAVNDHLINLDELSKVMKRASCFLPAGENDTHDNVKDFNNFVRMVAKISLKSRDILANGLPVKTVFLDGDSGAYNKDATMKHPKLKFTRKDKDGAGFYLRINHLSKKGEVEKTTERKIGKFAEFVKKVEMTNRQSHFYNYNYGNGGDWVRTHEGGWEPRGGKPNSCATKLLELLTTYAEGLTDDDKATFVGSVNREQSEAEKRSEVLLKEACIETGSVAGERTGKKGYVVKGHLREYFVEEDSLRVYDNKTGNYFCVVNGNGDPGVGRDALVARLYALHADKFVTKQIGTLAGK